ncbi:MAG: YjbQ family protein [Candidatus Blackburnbacteria bacterium]|nr:YjbQ family protein [Candidatus Blackburnbacteria bacterium]
MVILRKIAITSSDTVPEFIDITNRVEEEVGKSGIKIGQALIFSQHTTAAIVIQEPEPGVQKDLQELLSKIAPKNGDYKHTFAPDHIKDGMPNAHSHCQHALLGASQTIPIVDGQLMLGQYQRIFLVELDRSRVRFVIIQILGDMKQSS